MATKEQVRHRADIRKLEAERDKLRMQREEVIEKTKVVRQNLKVLRARKVR
jgi:hypothetical protein